MQLWPHPENHVLRVLPAIRCIFFDFVTGATLISRSIVLQGEHARKGAGYLLAEGEACVAAKL